MRNLVISLDGTTNEPETGLPSAPPDPVCAGSMASGFVAANVDDGRKLGQKRR